MGLEELGLGRRHRRRVDSKSGWVASIFVRDEFVSIVRDGLLSIVRRVVFEKSFGRSVVRIDSSSFASFDRFDSV